MTQNSPQTTDQAPLGFDWRDMAKLRVRPAEFARMVAVSRQTVSQWIATGKVTLGADGRLDPAQAAKQVIANSDPSRLRARVFKAATEDADSLRQRIAALEAQLRGARERVAYLEGFNQSQEWHHEFFIKLLKARWEILRDSPADLLAIRLEMLDEIAILLADGIDPNIADDAGGHDPQALLDRELALDDLRAIDETEGGAGA